MQANRMHRTFPAAFSRTSGATAGPLAEPEPKANNSCSFAAGALVKPATLLLLAVPNIYAHTYRIPE